MPQLPTTSPCPEARGCQWSQHRRKHFPHRGMSKGHTRHGPARYLPGTSAEQVRALETETVRAELLREPPHITTPDATSDNAITQVVISGAEFLVDADRELPWQLAHGETAFEFNLELGLAEQWALELRILLGYALQVRRA